MKNNVKKYKKIYSLQIMVDGVIICSYKTTSVAAERMKHMFLEASVYKAQISECIYSAQDV